jgi:hypothetical protein
LIQHPPEDINPFEQHIVNMMLNTLGVPVGRIEKISGNFPRIISGHGIEVGRERYDDIKKLAQGGFAKVYVGKYQGQLEALKVYIHVQNKKNMHELREIFQRVHTYMYIVSSGSKSSSGVGVGGDRGTAHSAKQQRPADVDGERFT